MNNYIKRDNYSILEITNRKGIVTEVLIDNDEVEFCKNFKWYCHSKNYILCFYKGKNFYMHRLIMELTKKDPKEVDHVNNIRSDNRKQNLRVTIRRFNGKNRSSNKNSSSDYLGVSYDKNNKKWLACIKNEYTKKTKFLGRFITELEAAEAYDKAALEYYGEFANLNIEA